jgi:myosin heavy subunit
MKNYGLISGHNTASLYVSHCVIVVRMYDPKEFEGTVKTLKIHVFSEDEQDVIFRTVASVKTRVP